MSTFVSNFRLWWRPPGRLRDRAAERSVTFLELFYDLVYVVLIAELAHTLAGNVTVSGVGGFAFLFIFVWWAWLNGAWYHDLHGQNDIRTRVFTFLQMSTVAAMAVFAHDALGESSVGFALSFVAYQLLLTYLWWRTGVHDPDHRPLSGPYSAVFLLTTILVFISVFVPAPWRFALWAAALLLSVLLPLLVLSVGRNDSRVQAQVERVLNVSPSAVERFGLFGIIVLGEVIVGVVQGLAAHDDLTWSVGVTAVLAMVVALGLWWVYFDFVSSRPPLAKRFAVSGWTYAHLFMTMGIAATGAAVSNVVALAPTPLSADVRWLLAGAVALAFLAIAVLMRTIRLPEGYHDVYRRGRLVTLVAALAILLLGFSGLGTIPFLLVLLLFMLSPVFYGVKIWITVLGAEEMPVA